MTKNSHEVQQMSKFLISFLVDCEVFTIKEGKDKSAFV